MHTVVVHFLPCCVNIMIFECCYDSVMFLDCILNVKNFTVIYILNACYMAGQNLCEISKKFIL